MHFCAICLLDLFGEVAWNMFSLVMFVIDAASVSVLSVYVCMCMNVCVLLVLMC